MLPQCLEQPDQFGCKKVSRWSTLSTMNEMKRKVRIRLRTDIDGVRQVLEAAGVAYVKGDYTYIRYEETAPELSGVTTTLKLGKDEITVLRHGAVRSEQRFAAGTTRSGYYETAEGRFRLETTTERVNTRFKDGLGSAFWTYRLLIQEAEAGRFQMNLDVQEGLE